MADGIKDQARILVVDDEEPLRKLLISALQASNEYEVFEAGDGVEAQDILSTQTVDVVVTDLVMPRLGGEALMRWMHQHYPDINCIILTGQGTMADAVEAVRVGAFDFVLKGPNTVSTLLPRVRHAVEQRRHSQETKRLHAQIEQQNIRLKEQVASLRDACQMLSQQADMIQEDFLRAANIQRALLPREPPQIEGVALDALYRPCDYVGGDLYDVVRLDDRRLGVCVADAAGHGVAAAMLAVIFKSRLCLIDPETAKPISPRAVFENLNEQLVEECRAPRMFVSSVYCLIDTATGDVTLSSAGHPPVLVHRSNGRVERISHSGPALGLTPGAQFAQIQISLLPGDRILLYTDGLFQTIKGRPSLTTEKITEILSQEELNGIDLLQRLLNSATDHTKGPQQDDITLLMVSFAPLESQVDNGVPIEKPHSSLASQSETGFEMALGRIDRTTLIHLQGHARWTYAAAFHQACITALDDRTPLILDFSNCQYLDSTFLGTIHELASRADRMETTICLQNMPPQVRALFDELGMEHVLACVVHKPQPFPDGMVTLDQVYDAAGSMHRVLKAHEALAALNEENRRQFSKLAEYLRKEIQGNSDSS
jgi:anti-anti-sigma factor